MQKADEITEATVRVDQPPPENVSNEWDPLAQDIDSGIMGNDTQGEAASGAEGTGKPEGGAAVGSGKMEKFSEMTPDEAMKIAQEYRLKAPIEVPDSATIKPAVPKSEILSGNQWISRFEWQKAIEAYHSNTTPVACIGTRVLEGEGI